LLAAEFIVSLADKHSTFESFKKVLIENGASFSVRFLQVSFGMQVLIFGQ